MTLQILSVLVGIYVVGLVLLRRAKYTLIGYLWSAIGLAALGILAAQLGEWNVALGRVEAATLARALGGLGVEVGGVQRSSLVVPDPTGWSIVNIGIECSTLVEGFILFGLLMFYPRFTASQRVSRLTTGLAATYLVNLIRLAIIIGMILWLGKPAAPLAHAVVGRLVFFLGMIVVYWLWLTVPTLHIVRREMDVTGRAVL